MLTIAVFCVAGVGLLLWLTLIFLHGVSERNGWRQVIELRQADMMSDMEHLVAYAEETHQMCQKLMILTPEGKKAAKEFMNFTTAPGGFMPH